MSRYPGATWKPLPQNATQSRITPTVVVFHSTAGGSMQSAENVFKDTTRGTEAHFVVGYDGEIWQFMDTSVRADAQWDANGYAVSIETLSNVAASDPWTTAQLAALTKLGRWLLATHKGIGRRICRTPTDPGFGYHRLFQSWNQSAHSCPGNARVAQFPKLVQSILAPTSPPSGADMTVAELDAYLASPAGQKRIAVAFLAYVNAAALPYPPKDTDGTVLDVYGLIRKAAAS